MHRMAVITIEPLTAVAFAPFGWIIAPPSRPPGLRSSAHQYWDDLVPFEADGPAALGLLQVRYRPLQFNEMECHDHHTQAFVALGQQEAAIAVAPPRKVPR